MRDVADGGEGNILKVTKRTIKKRILGVSLLDLIDNIAFWQIGVKNIVLTKVAMPSSKTVAHLHNNR